VGKLPTPGRARWQVELVVGGHSGERDKNKSARGRGVYEGVCMCAAAESVSVHKRYMISKYLSCTQWRRQALVRKRANTHDVASAHA
jgi:hypothetical protein